MKTDFFIASRLRLREQGSRRSVISTRISIAATALSVAVMLLAIAIVTGFKQQITEKIIGFDSQITVTPYETNYERRQPVTFDSSLYELIRKAVPEASIDASISQPALLKTEGNFATVVFRAYADSKDWSFIRDNLVEGEIPFSYTANGKDIPGILLSRNVASKLGLKLNDKITVCFINDGKMRLRKYPVKGIYCSTFNEYDNVVAFAAWDELAKIDGITPEEAYGIEISGLPLDKIEESTFKIQSELNRAIYEDRLDNYLQATSILQSGALYFNWLDLLDMNVVVILTLMGAIAAFTLIASLFTLVLERVSLIGTLKTIGARDALIRRIFIILTSRILLTGLLVGNAVALGLIALQYFTHLIPLDPEAYFISYVPVRITLWQVVSLNLGAIALALAVMTIPSMVISRMSPAETVKFE